MAWNQPSETKKQPKRNKFSISLLLKLIFLLLLIVVVLFLFFTYCSSENTGLIDVEYRNVTSRYTGVASYVMSFYWYAEDWTPLYEKDGVFEYLLLNDLTYAVKASSAAANSTDIVIPSTFNGKAVTKIMPEGFKGLANVESITIPASINEIGQYAFKGCTAATLVMAEKATWSCEFGYITARLSGNSMSTSTYNVTITTTPSDFTSSYFTNKRYTINDNYYVEQMLVNATLKKQ
jgi:hypothetical protein